ncbi:hypothetical protein C2S51_000626 [Perilla frutescens var. frutescens]|nr:hypothetical protein C2S51_000626 [Perilla frutescens var. frutescens]
MIGLSDQFLQIRDALVKPHVRRRISPPKIIGWISGMAGIGKTTIAKRVFNDPSVKENFGCRAFVTVGLELQLDQVLQSITSQINLDYEEMIVEGDEGDDLYERFLRILSARKSLIVLDDVWVEEWEAIIGKRLIIEDPGSRILVTSRSDAFSTSHFCALKVRFMNEEESWELLKMNVFDDEEEVCSPQLVKAGKKIAHKCEGLPLLIIAVANQIKSNVEDWNRVAEKPNSVLEEASHQISEVLLSSYHRISEEEKLRFLYIAAFPLNYIVLHSTIVNLWCVEGFIAPWDISFVNNFHLLLEKNLVLGHQKSWTSGETKACSLHSAYWYLSKRVANDNKILYVINTCADGLDECVKSHRRLAIYENVLLAIKEVHNKIASISAVRSLLCTGPYHQYEVPLCLEWKLLKILDALTIRFYEFPVEVVKLTRLRYLALTCNANLPPSISKLWSLEFLIVHQHLSIKRAVAADDHESYVPVEIWKLQELEHLEIPGRNLPDPPHPGVVLPNLKKLLDVGVESCTKGVLESFRRLQKLRIQIDPDAAASVSCLDDISCFYLLKSFQCVIMNPLLLPAPPLSIFPSLILKLSLSGFGYPWEDMHNIAELPNLKVLKLKCYAFQGENWEAEEMRFPELGHLFIEDTDLVQWTAGDQTFKWLTRLTIKNCYNLEEIPRLPEDVDIELVDCNPLVESCANQWSYYVKASYSWNEKKLKP